ncbi:25890_t:CDS:2, partial [Gigaspora margarita]
FHIILVSKCWYKDEKQVEPISTFQQQFFTDDKVFLEIPYKIPNISYKHVHKSLNQRKEYIKANGLSKKAIQMGLDAEPSALQEFNDFMKNFIKRHTLKRVSGQELTYKNVKKRKILNLDPSLIQNPVVRLKRGAPHKTCFKGSQELKPKTLGQKPTECQQCHKPEHNKA